MTRVARRPPCLRTQRLASEPSSFEGNSRVTSPTTVTQHVDVTLRTRGVLRKTLVGGSRAGVCADNHPPGLLPPGEAAPARRSGRGKLGSCQAATRRGGRWPPPAHGPPPPPVLPRPSQYILRESPPPLHQYFPVPSQLIRAAPSANPRPPPPQRPQLRKEKQEFSWRL